MRIILHIFCLIFLCSMKPSTGYNKFNHCELSKPSINNYEPEKFTKTNNLLVSSETIEKKQNKIIIIGNVVDHDCAPIADAKIYIWQTNESGRYVYEILRNKFKKEGNKKQNGESFHGSGIATSDNYGKFSFTTAFPGSYHKEHPHINVRVEHPTLGNLQTKYYLDNITPKAPLSDLKELDKIVDFMKDNSLTKEENISLKIYRMDRGYPIISPYNHNIYNFQIVLPTKKNYKRY